MARRTLALGTAGFVAVVLVWILITLPPRQAKLRTTGWKGRAGAVATGALHVHTDRSDGTGSVEEVAAAASRAGLQFVVITDHGDGTRAPDPPAYRRGVLCLDGVEISTAGGHYLAMGMRQAPYPLAGEPRAVIEDVARLGGFGIAAHPMSGKADLQWRDWSAPVDAIEWLNADSEWRDEAVRRLLAALLHYPFRPVESLGSLLDRPESALARWDTVTRRRRVVGLAGADAHARLSLPVGAREPRDEPALLKVPRYEHAFRTFAVRVELDTPLSGDAARDAGTLLQSIRDGRVYTAIDAIASPALFEFFARAGGAIVPMGGEVREARAGEVELIARAALPPGAIMVLVRDGKIVRTEPGPELKETVGIEQAVYRVEVRVAAAPGTPPVPWLVSNPIYVGTRASVGPVRPAPATVRELLTRGEHAAWTIERDPRSGATVESSSVPGGGLVLRYRLAAGEPSGQYVALVRGGLGDLAAYDRLSLRIRADRPSRLSLQVRIADQPQAPRWQRSIYVSSETRSMTVFFDEMAPVEGGPARAPDLRRVHAILVVVDTTNARPETSGVLRLDDIRLEGPR